MHINDVLSRGILGSVRLKKVDSASYEHTTSSASLRSEQSSVDEEIFRDCDNMR